METLKPLVFFVEHHEIMIFSRTSKKGFDQQKYTCIIL